MRGREDCEALFLENLGTIDGVIGAVSRRHGLSRDEAEEFASWARLKLIEDDYATFRKFRGESAITTYLTVVIAMLFRDYRVQRWGRWRPSAAAQRRGALAVRLETLVYRDGLRVGEAAQLLRTTAETALPDRALAALLAELPARSSPRGGARAPANDVSVDTLASDAAADDPLLRGEADDDRTRLGRQLGDAIARLPTEDQALVRLRYWEGLSVADAARALGVPQKPLYRRLERLVGALRADLIASGVEAERVRALLDESMPEPGIHPAGDESSARPSISAPGHEERIA